MSSAVLFDLKNKLLNSVHLFLSDKQTGRQTSSQTKRQTDKQSDKQTESVCVDV